LCRRETGGGCHCRVREEHAPAASAGRRRGQVGIRGGPRNRVHEEHAPAATAGTPTRPSMRRGRPRPTCACWGGSRQRGQPLTTSACCGRHRTMTARNKVPSQRRGRCRHRARAEEAVIVSLHREAATITLRRVRHRAPSRDAVVNNRKEAVIVGLHRETATEHAATSASSSTRRRCRRR
jgi:hypothetical protein